MDFDDEFDCQSCGACCQAHSSYENKGYVKIYDEDVARMTPEQVQKFTIQPTEWCRAMILDKDKRCIALQGEIGRNVSCEIYENRPDVCRNFEKGDHSCRFARMEAGLGPFSLDDLC